MEVEVTVLDFPVLLAGLRTLLFSTGGCQTLLAAGRRDVAVVEVVVLSTVSPDITERQYSTLNILTELYNLFVVLLLMI